MTSLTSDGIAAGAVVSAPVAAVRNRIAAIDATRGLVMIFMLLDHVRETWFLHMQVSDPVNAMTTDPALFFTRFLSTFCAPVFVALTGLGAWLYGQSHTKAETSAFLVKRGLFLIFLELTFVAAAWATTPFIPKTFWLQVIWAIGISMICLGALLHLPRPAQIAVGLVIVCGHNLLDGIRLAPTDDWYVAWAVLHQRSTFDLGGGLAVKTSYPILPWIGLMLLGYAVGPWFGKDADPEVRSRRLLTLGVGLIVGFVLLRWTNLYGDKPWFDGGETIRTVMSFLAMTKYPPSLLFLMPTIGAGALMLYAFEKWQNSRIPGLIALFGGAPMFFYLLHLYTLKAIYNVALLIYGPTKGTVFGVDSVAWVWLWFFALIPPLYVPTRWFAELKQRRRDIAWLKYL